MDDSKQQAPLTRRKLLQAAVVASSAALLAACGEERSQNGVAENPTPAPVENNTPPAGATILEPTPSCVDEDEPTPPQTEGPFFTPESPERTSLLDDGIEGTKMVLAGRILTTDCRPIAGALLDFWQADDEGVYDNEGYRLRGHQFTDDEGRYRLETIVPGLYPGRTRHFHVKVQAQGGSVLTTQLYFPDEPANQQDAIFHPALLIALQDNAEGRSGTFDFVLAAS